MSLSRATSRKWILFGAATAILILVVELVEPGPITYIVRKPSRTEMDALLAEGDSIVRLLDAYHAIHRRYPSRLPESHTPQGAQYGRWRYHCSAKCTKFELTVGSYPEHSFALQWQFDKETWYIDG